MKPSRFNLWVKDYPGKGDYLLYNTRTQALIKINQELKKALDGLNGRQNSAPLNQRIKDNLPALKANGVIVEDAKEDQAKLKDFFRQLKTESETLAFEATVLTTYACNFACVYCFEESVKNDIFMAQDTSEQVVRWITRKAEKNGYRRIFLVYYGGEPLLHVRPIYDISWHLMQWAQAKKIEFGFAIITNGSLLNPDLIDKFLSVGLKEVRITIDGDREAHNKKRPLVGGGATFDLIVNNIKSIIDKISVGVAGNFDRENFAGISRLLDYLEQEGLLYRLKGIDFVPLSPRLGPKNNPGSIELSECLSYIGKDGLFNEVIAVKKELLRRKIEINSGLAINSCSMVMADSAVTIDPEGLIYNCNALLGYPEFSIGKVSEGEFNPRQKEFCNIDAWDKCAQDCPYIPMCQGGCRFYSYLENKNFTDLACKREYFDRVSPELIKLEFEKLKTQQAT
jgi:uncharacterized protein